MSHVFPGVGNGLTNGLPIKVTATSSPGNAIHSVASSAPGPDCVSLYVTNTDTVDRNITVEFGDATAPDHNVTATIQAGAGPTLVIPGWPLPVGYSVKVFGSAASVLTCFCTVTRFADHRGN